MRTIVLKSFAMLLVTSLALPLPADQLAGEVFNKEDPRLQR